MEKEKIKKELEVFKDFIFFEEDHHYEYKGQRVGISVTRLIEEYTQPFNEVEIASRVAEKNQQIIDRISRNRWQDEEDFELLNKILMDKTNTVQGNLDLWRVKNEQACLKGSISHETVQNLWTGISCKGTHKSLTEVTKTALKSIFKQEKNFYNDFKDKFEHLADEFVIGSDEYDIASAIDHLFINKLTGGLVLVDYKTNTDIYKNEKYAKNMKVPLQHLKDTTLNHYYLQLSIYRFLVEKYTGLKIEDMFIVWFSELNDNYEIIEVPYLKNEVKKILENRRCKNMNSVPILVIGKSGSGKSTSLRNFKKDEIAVVNVLGKPLPFKSEINAPKCDDYNTIINSISKTDRKTIVIDDANYLITNEFMKNSSIKGYDKYNDMANNFFNLINSIKNIEGGKTVYLFMHEDTDDFGNIKPKTIGKLLDDKVNIQGMFTICIRAMYENGNYIFRLKTNGQDCVKTPFGMFEEEIMENDLKKFDEIVREYYELDKENK